MGNFAMKQWRLKVQHSCKNIPCFSTCCKGEINVHILSDDGENLELCVLRCKQSGRFQWKEAVYST